VRVRDLVAPRSARSSASWFERRFATLTLTIPIPIPFPNFFDAPPSLRRFLPLQWAALNNRVAVATYLIEKGAAVNATDKDKQTPLHWACVRGSLPCAELLLRSGARLDQADCRGYDPVHVAAQYGHTGMIYHFKMRWDANVDAHDNDGRTPLHWAAYKGFPDAVKLLLYCDANIARADKEGCTPLHWAAIRGKAEAAHILAQAGGPALLDARDVEGSTATQLATEKGHKSLGGFLAAQQDKHRRGAKGKFWDAKGMAVACAALILGLVTLFVHAVVLAPGMATPDVTVAAWSWMVILSAGAGLAVMYRVSYNDPGFIDPSGASESGRPGGGKKGGSDVEGEPSRGGGGVSGFAGAGSGSGQVRASNEHLNHPELWAGNWGALCTTCKLVKPWGAKHCGVTNRCVRRFDHYCPWMGNAIGKRNHRDFVVFLMLETFAMAAAFAVALTRLYSGGPTPAPLTATGLVVFLVADGCTLLPVFMLTAAQVSQATRNITTNELANAHRYHYLRDADGRFANPFDRGWVENVRAFALAEENEEEVQRQTAMSVREMEGILMTSGS